MLHVTQSDFFTVVWTHKSKDVDHFHMWSWIRHDLWPCGRCEKGHIGINVFFSPCIAVVFPCHTSLCRHRSLTTDCWSSPLKQQKATAATLLLLLLRAAPVTSKKSLSARPWRVCIAACVTCIHTASRSSNLLFDTYSQRGWRLTYVSTAVGM